MLYCGDGTVVSLCLYLMRAFIYHCCQDLAPFGIRVNAVSPALIGPGFMWTRQNELHAKSGSPYFASDPEVVAQNKIAKYVVS